MNPRLFPVYRAECFSKLFPVNLTKALQNPEEVKRFPAVRSGGEMFFGRWVDEFFVFAAGAPARLRQEAPLFLLLHHEGVVRVPFGSCGIKCCHVGNVEFCPSLESLHQIRIGKKRCAESDGVRAAAA